MQKKCNDPGIMDSYRTRKTCCFEIEKVKTYCFENEKGKTYCFEIKKVKSFILTIIGKITKSALHTTYQNLVEKVFIHRKSFESSNEGRKYVARERT